MPPTTTSQRPRPKVPGGSFTIGPKLIQARAWQRHPGIVHRFSTRHTDLDEFISLLTKGRKRTLRPVQLKQVHSDLVHAVDAPPDHLLTGDALLTGTPGLLLVVKTADCLPILLYEPRAGAIAAIHSGWRGTLARIAQKTVGVMRAHFGAQPERIHAVIGPGIGACCYEVGEEVLVRFRAQFSYADELFRALSPENPADILLPRQFRTGPGPLEIERVGLMRKLEPSRAHLDLEEAVRRQLIEAGVAAGNIIGGAPCTACRTDLLYSYRREGKAAGRLYGAIALGHD